MLVEIRHGLFVTLLLGMATLLASPAKAGVITQTADFAGTIAYAGSGITPLNTPFLPTSLPPTFDNFDNGLGTLDSVIIEITFDLSLRANSVALGVFPFSGFSQHLQLSPSTLFFSFGGFPPIAYSLPSRTGSCVGTVSCAAILPPLVVPLGLLVDVFPAGFGTPGAFDISHIGTLTSFTSGPGLPGLVAGRSNISGTIDVSYIYTSLEPGGESVPEPGPIGVLALGLAGSGLARRRRQSMQTSPRIHRARATNTA